MTRIIASLRRVVVASQSRGVRPSSSPSSASPPPSSSPSTHPDAARVAQEAREEAMWISKPTNSRLIQPPTPTSLSAAAAAEVAGASTLALEEYLRRRDWGADSKTTAVLASPGLRILSHLLSYPLTLAHYLPQLQKAAGGKREEGDAAAAAAAMHLAILGARAEASLPSAWWKELLCLHPGHLHFHMVGPEMPRASAAAKAAAAAGGAASAAEHVVLDATSQLWLHRHHGLYHELVADVFSSSIATPTAATAAPAGSIDAAVLYNPGLGHPALKAAWKPTLAKLQAQGKPVLWTAHSQEDRDRDVALLAAQGGKGDGDEKQSRRVEWLVGPERNPFASRKRLVDPLDARHVLAANEYAGVFLWV